MEKQRNTVFDNIREIKGYITGVVAFSIAVTTYLVQLLHLEAEIVLPIVSGIAVSMIVIGFLIQRSEGRQKQALEVHIKESQQLSEKIESSLLENQRSSLRVEMNLMMSLKSENHDTIIKMAERYFLELHGDWVETDEFGAWVERENEVGRKVHVPTTLAATVASLQMKEKEL